MKYVNGSCTGEGWVKQPPHNPEVECFIVRSWTRDNTRFTSHYVYAETFEEAARLVKARKQGVKGGVRFTLQDGTLNDADEVIL